MSLREIGNRIERVKMLLEKEALLTAPNTKLPKLKPISSKPISNVEPATAGTEAKKDPAQLPGYLGTPGIPTSLVGSNPYSKGTPSKTQASPLSSLNSIKFKQPKN